MKYKRNIIVLYSKTLNPDNWTEMDKKKKKGTPDSEFGFDGYGHLD